MKYLVSLLMLAVVSTACNQPQEKEQTQDLRQIAEKDSLAVLDCFLKQQECWNRQDMECFVSWYSPSERTQIMSKRGPIRGQDSILIVYKRAFPVEKMGHLSFDNLDLIRLSDQYYYVTGRYNVKHEDPDTTDTGWFTILMEKKDSMWYMLSDHTS